MFALSHVCYFIVDTAVIHSRYNNRLIEIAKMQEGVRVEGMIDPHPWRGEMEHGRGVVIKHYLFSNDTMFS